MLLNLRESLVHSTDGYVLCMPTFLPIWQLNSVLWLCSTNATISNNESNSPLLPPSCAVSNGIRFANYQPRVCHRILTRCLHDLQLRCSWRSWVVDSWPLGVILMLSVSNFVKQLYRYVYLFSFLVVIIRGWWFSIGFLTVPSFQLSNWALKVVVLS